MSKPDNLVLDPEFQRLLIPLSADERRMLEESLQRDGCRDPLVAWREKRKLILIDGHNRYAICEEHGIAYNVKIIKVESREWVRVWIRKNQLGRRNLIDDARGMVAARLLKDLAKLSRDQQLTEARQAKADKKAGKKASVEAAVASTEKTKAKKGRVRVAVAKQANVSERKVRNAGKLEDRAKGLLGTEKGTELADKVESGDLAMKKAKRMLDKIESQQKLDAAKAKAAQMKASEADKTLGLRVCTMETLLAEVRDVDLILTDPPYSAEHIPLYATLAQMAKKALRPGGVLAVMVPTVHQPQICACMSQHIPYRYELSYMLPGPAARIWSQKIYVGSKPILLFGGVQERWMSSVIWSDQQDKRFCGYGWGQSESGFERLVECLSEPGGLVCDPFVGGGTTAVAALKLNRNFIGCDQDQKQIETARSRVSELAAELSQRQRASDAARDAMPHLTHWINKIHQADCLEIMNQMPTNSIDLVVTSPPYNLRNSTGNGMKDAFGGKWENAQLADGYDSHDDDMPHEKYVAWQRTCLQAMMRVLREDGAIFYNHKWRVQDGLLQDRSDIVKGFPVRQIIIWQRDGGFNFNPGYFLPTYEVIYLICKPNFKLAPRANAIGDVWRISQESNNPHPAPFPVELARRCIESTNAKIVLDPFMGSGTTAVAAEDLGRNWIGIEQSKRYCEDADERLRVVTAA